MTTRSSGTYDLLARLGLASFLGGLAVFGLASASSAQSAGSVQAQTAFVAVGPTVAFQFQQQMPALTADRAARLRAALERVNRPGPAPAADKAASAAIAPPPGSETRAVDPRIQAPGDFTIFGALPLSDAQTDNSTSVINEPSVAVNFPNAFVTGNWFAARSQDNMVTFTYVDPDLALPAIPGQFFCCDQSVIYDRSRDMFIWVSLWVNAGVSTGTLRISISEDLTNWTVYDLTSGTFGLAGLADFPHIALGANNLYLTINHFNPSFTQSTWARLPLTEMKRRADMNLTFINRNEFNLKAAHDYGPGTTGYAGTHINNTTVRVFRWQEGSPIAFWNNVAIPAWTRGSRFQFNCVTPSGNDPCQRLDDRILGGIVTGPKKLPAGATAQRVVSFSWTARQGGAFPMPYTNIVRIDADTWTLIDNPVMWNTTNAFVYADFEPNDRGDWAGIVDQIGATHPTVVGTLLQEASAVPPGWDLNLIRSGTNSPASNTWGDYNTVRRVSPYGYIFLGGGHTLQGGTANGNVETVLSIFGREDDLF